MFDKALVDLRIFKALSELRDYRLYDEDVRTLVVSADVVDLTVDSALCHHVDRFAVILDIEPVAYLHSVSVDRKLLVISCVVDHKRNEFFRELPHSVIVAASCYVHGHLVSVVKSLYEKIG